MFKKIASGVVGLLCLVSSSQVFGQIGMDVDVGPFGGSVGFDSGYYNSYPNDAYYYDNYNSYSSPYYGNYWGGDRSWNYDNDDWRGHRGWEGDRGYYNRGYGGRLGHGVRLGR